MRSHFTPQQDQARMRKITSQPCTAWRIHVNAYDWVEIWHLYQTSSSFYSRFLFWEHEFCYNYSSQTFPLWASTLGTEVAQELSESLVPLTYHFWNYYQSHLAMHRRPATDCHPVLLWSHGVWELPFDMHETAFLKYLHNLLHRCWLYHPINRSYLLMAQAQSFSVDNYREAK